MVIVCKRNTPSISDSGCLFMLDNSTYPELTRTSLLMADGHSYLRQYPLWKPRTLDPDGFGMADLIEMAINEQPPKG
jgi:hypothetical protein